MKDLIERFLAKVEPSPSSECLIWTGAQNSKGYGHLKVHPRYGLPFPIITKAHRLSYWLFRGPFDTTLVLDHRCHTRLCVNCYHLEPVTVLENSIEANRFKVYGLEDDYWRELDNGF